MNYRPDLCPRCHNKLEHTVIDELHYCRNCHEMWSDEDIFWFRVDQDVDNEIKASKLNGADGGFDLCSDEYLAG